MAPYPEDYQVKEIAIALHAGVTAVLKASLSSSPYSFSVSLETSQHADVPFRFTTCLHDRTLLLHRRRHCIWEKAGPLLSQPFPFSSDKSFQLQIRLSPSGGQTLEISVDKVSLATVDIERESVRRINKLRVVDVPNLDGLLSLSDVSLAVETDDLDIEERFRTVTAVHNAGMQHQVEVVRSELDYIRSSSLEVQASQRVQQPRLLGLRQVPVDLSNESTLLHNGSSCGLISFQSGIVIDLVSLSSGCYLRMHDDGSVDARGGSELEAVFMVIGRDDSGVFALQNCKFPQHWLAIKDGIVTHANDERCCDFKVREAAGFHVTLESVIHPGIFISVLPNGDVRPTRGGRDSLFRPATVFV
ncbi:uncharacterized protein LOC134184658 [Corticium candelabrum]|uniref:uncharacterized protein LOC134184658 n=1 Tax=Corticium candelabrum TaxID=121492 RepID=UPI002E375168|nr:uncharacterized protein LOC134184658 [Corticium candelabrum]